MKFEIFKDKVRKKLIKYDMCIASAILFTAMIGMVYIIVLASEQ